MSEFLWTTDDLAKAMHGRRFGDLPKGVTGISIDTRTIKPGEAFFAIKGDRFDGHQFVTQAMKAGATLAVVAEERLVAMGRTSLPFIVVDDVLEAMRRLAHASRARTSAKIVAVTGSVGKTTTKEMLRTALSASGTVHASEASFNNHWGVPLTLARMPQDTAFGVFEIGMNHAGEITPLVAMVRPHVAVVTTIAPAHIGAFGAIEGISHAKAEIFSGLVEGGTAILNKDNGQYGLLRELAGKAGVSSIKTFGKGEDCDWRLLSYSDRDGGGAVASALDGEEFVYAIGSPGEHIALNSLIVVGAAGLLGADRQKTADALSAFTAGKGRGERHKIDIAGGSVAIIDESYNANNASMEAALRMLAAAEPGPGGRRIAVLGDMLELGGESERLHRELAAPVRDSGAGMVYLAGPEMHALADSLGDSATVVHRQTAAELAPLLLGEARAGDVFVFKASKGIGFARLVEEFMASLKQAAAAGR